MSFKKTNYFKHRREKIDRQSIEDDWIEYVIRCPEKIAVQTDGRIRKWARIKAVDKYLRVILLSDNETVHNAFFDRSFKKGE